jgi:AraC-like DNA-binding protein
MSEKLCEDRVLRSIISQYLSVAANLASELDPIGQQVATEHMLDLAGLLVGTTPEQNESPSLRSYSAARLELMKTHILRNLRRTELNIGEIARLCNLSQRQAQRLFVRSGMTFSEFVLEQRLLLAWKLLRDPRQRNAKVSSVAHDAGFGDVSYFHRRFRNRFGLSPGDVRISAAGDTSFQVSGLEALTKALLSEKAAEDLCNIRMDWSQKPYGRDNSGVLTSIIMKKSGSKDL